MNDFVSWVWQFQAAADQRRADGDPLWARGTQLDPALIHSLQRFQIGEDGDGASLISKAIRAGDPAYLAAARLFVAEERNHARLLGLLLTSAGATTIASHWSDAVFVRLRRLLGLRLELMTLMLAEVVALRYYEALRDGTDDPLLTDVAGRILLDEQRHVPFHCQRLRDGFAQLHAPARAVLAAGWWVLLAGAVIVVAGDHGPALCRLGVRRTRFATDVARLFRGVVTEVFGRPTSMSCTRDAPCTPPCVGPCVHRGSLSSDGCLLW